MLAQQEHEGVFQPGRARLRDRALQQRSHIGGAGMGLADVAHRAASGHGVGDQAARVNQARLQLARGLSGGRPGRAGQPRRLFPQALRRALRKHAALMQHEHLGAARGFVHVGGADDDAQALGLHQLLHDGPEVAPRERIDAHAGFVQQQQIGRAHQRAGQAQLLLHAAGELARRTPGKARQAGHLQQPGVARAAHGGRHAMQIGIQVKVFLHAQVFIQAKALRHVADAALHGLRLARAALAQLMAQHGKAPRVRRQQGGQQAHEGGFARAIRPDQRRELPRARLQRHLAQRVQPPACGRGEGLADALGLDDEAHGVTARARPARRETGGLGCAQRRRQMGQAASFRSCINSMMS